MRFGVNLLLYGDSFTPAVARRLPGLRALGADGVEIPVFDPPKVRVDEIRRTLARAGMGITISGALPRGACWYTTRAARLAAERYVRGCVSIARQLGVGVVCGPLYKPVGDFDMSVPLDRQRRLASRAMQEVASMAAEAGVVLALEPLNRFETNMINTTEQGIEFCSVAGPGVGLLLDTFHMHIEEKNTPAALRAAAKAGVLSHVHMSENDRGTAGTGQVHWSDVAAALRYARYDSWVVIETFSQRGEAIRKAVSCWRPFYKNETEFVRDGLRFVRRLLAAPRR